MSIDTLPVRPFPPRQPLQEAAVIDSREIKAILYLGLKGEISLPKEKHEVDILA